MSSLADELFEDFAVPVLLEHAGQADAAYLTARGEAQTGPFDVILEHAVTQRIENDSGRTLEHSLIAKFPVQAPLPFWTGASLVGLIVTIDGTDWVLDLVENLSDSLAVVRLLRRATSEVSRPGFRRT